MVVLLALFCALASCQLAGQLLCIHLFYIWFCSFCLMALIFFVGYDALFACSGEPLPSGLFPFFVRACIF
jgi:hypothetical protein